MEQCVDLHLHSCYSDGLHPPAELVRMAAEKGMRAIAITDHDSVDGIDEALEAAERLGVEVIPGVELTVAFRGYRDVHLLGYLIDHHDQAFIARLTEFRTARDERGRKIVDRINSRLVQEKRGSIAYEEVLAIAGGAVGRPHIARVLIGKGFARTIEEAFNQYLVPCNVPKFQISMAEAMAELQRIRGVAVLAHPPSICEDRTTLKNMIRELAGMGLDGLEVFSNMCYKDDINFFNNLAAQLGLAITGGSDYHGIEDDVEIGRGRGELAVPYRLVETLKDVRERRDGNARKAQAK
ncbi:MAG TPA: PHP domain-containing protein [Geobacteraceae bacterium]|nr:PHP domain-containing protein [Geobacteraceae bacterium]